MAKFYVTISRSAYTNLTYLIEAEDDTKAEEVVSAQIDANNISALGMPVREETHDDEESNWEILDTEEAFEDRYDMGCAIERARGE